MGTGRINREMIGYGLERPPVMVDGEACRAFARATGDNRFIGAGALTTAPPLFVVRLWFPLLQSICYHRNLKLNLLRMVHGEQGVIWYRPIHMGEQLRLRAAITDIRDTAAGELLQITGQAYGEDGLKVEGTTGLLVRSRRRKGPRTLKRPPRGTPCLQEVISTSEGQPMAFARASGDTNFIHTSALLAKLVGLPGNIMHGSCVLAMICTALARNRLHGDTNRLRAISGRFARPVLPGEQLTLTGYTLASPTEMAFEVCNPKGQAVFRQGLFAWQGDA